MSTDDYIISNFNAIAEFSTNNTGRIHSVTVQNYMLPDLFANGRCDISKSFIVCEQDVNQVFNIPIIKLKGLRRKLIFMVIYQKVNTPLIYQKTDQAFDDGAAGYSFRMKVINSTYTMSNMNFHINDYGNNNLVFVDRKFFETEYSDIL